MKAQAIILAAGKGTRMAADVPKILLKVGDKTIAERVIDILAFIGVTDPIFVVGHQKEKVVEFVNQICPTARFGIQEVLSGTATAAAAGLALTTDSSPTLLMMGDHPFYKAETLEKLLATHTREKAVLTMVTHVMDDARGYGHIVRDQDGKIMGIKETKGLAMEPVSAEVNMGCFVIDPDWAKENLVNIQPSPDSGEYYLTDLPSMAYQQGKKVSSVVVEDYIEAMGLNTPEHLEDAKSRS